MIISKETWETIAHEVIINFNMCGSPGKGNIDKLVGIKHLKNLVGFSLNAFNCALPDPDKWSEKELELAECGEKHFEFGASSEIQVLTAIKSVCHDEEIICLTVLPILFYSEGFLHFTPLFRVRQNCGDEPKFIDYKGRIYDDFSDWESHCALPSLCEFIFPSNGVLNGTSYSKKTKPSKDGTLKAIETAINLCETIGGPLGSLISSPLATVLPAYELYDRVTHGESINPLADKKAAGLWFNANLSISGPFGKIAQSLGISKIIKSDGTLMNNMKICTESVSNFKSFLNSEDENVTCDKMTKSITDAKLLLENPMTMKDIMTLMGNFWQTSTGCLKISILLGFYMRTKFTFFNRSKLELINEIYKIAEAMNETRLFRITDFREIIIGPLTIPLDLMDQFTNDDIIKLLGGLKEIQKHSHQSIHDMKRFFKKSKDFLTTLLMEQKIIKQHHETTLPLPVKENEEEFERNKNIEEIKIFATQEHKIMMTYHKHDYEIGSESNDRSRNIIRILQKRLSIFSKIIDTIRKLDFKKNINVTTGIIFQFTKHADGIGNFTANPNKSVSILTMLTDIYAKLRENFVPFGILKMPCGRVGINIGYNLRFFLNDLFEILKENASIEIFHQLCNLSLDESKVFADIKSNINNDQMFFKWLCLGSVSNDDGIMLTDLLLELRKDVFADEFKTMTQILTSENSLNGLILIKNGVYALLISIHVLQKLSTEERRFIMKTFQTIQDREELMNVIGKVFKDA